MELLSISGRPIALKFLCPEAYDSDDSHWLLCEKSLVIRRSDTSVSMARKRMWSED